MKIFVLCGGSGTRMKDYSFPKPLNMIYGKPSIYYTLMNLPTTVDTIHFIVAPHLITYNFEQIVINQFPTKKCIFHNIPYFTRGAAETAYIGTQDIEDSEEPIVFMDNDVMYNFPSAIFDISNTAFLGYSIDKTGSESYSFLTVDSDNNVIDYKEKQRISDKFVCGVYGFKNIQQFRKSVLKVLFNTSGKELYISSVFQLLIQDNEQIKAIQFNDTIHIGTLHELHASIDKIPTRKMRICFDLDNTLVTYPQVPGDYSTVKPNVPMIELARSLKEQGNTIIIHTARRMQTHSHNVGAVIRDIGLTTFKTLEDFGIPYDELIFGKPIADMYIDDRTINPYRSDMNCMGLLQSINEEKPINMLATNKYNTLTSAGSIVIKHGPTKFIRGEIHYYKNIPSDSKISVFFPKYISSKCINETTSELIMENIKGIPFYTLYKNKLITKGHIQTLMTMVDMLHNTPGEINITTQDIRDNYTRKLQERFKCVEDYPFDNTKEIQQKCLDLLEKYYETPTVIVPYIHGDLWFSNILVQFTGDIKWIDMKGQVNGILSLAGDPLYDYGKLLQSFFGYDVVLYNDIMDDHYRETLLNIFYDELTLRHINIDFVRTVCFSLILGTFHFIDNYSTKCRLWKWLTKIF